MIGEKGTEAIDVKLVIILINCRSDISQKKRKRKKKREE